MTHNRNSWKLNKKSSYRKGQKGRRMPNRKKNIFPTLKMRGAQLIHRKQIRLLGWKKRSNQNEDKWMPNQSIITSIMRSCQHENIHQQNSTIELGAKTSQMKSIKFQTHRMKLSIWAFRSLVFHMSINWKDNFDLLLHHCNIENCSTRCLACLGFRESLIHWCVGKGNSQNMLIIKIRKVIPLSITRIFQGCEGPLAELKIQFSKKKFGTFWTVWILDVTSVFGHLLCISRTLGCAPPFFFLKKKILLTKVTSRFFLRFSPFFHYFLFQSEGRGARDCTFSPNLLFIFVLTFFFIMDSRQMCLVV